MNIVTLGVHVVDVLVRPVERIPEGQGGTLVERIRITPAGPAGGTRGDPGQARRRRAHRRRDRHQRARRCDARAAEPTRVDASLLVRREEVQTSASVLPIRRDGSRPAFHVIGANATYSSADAPWAEIAAADYLHLGAPEFMGGEEAAKILSFARERGVLTSADILPPGEQAAAILDWIAPALEHIDYLLPNEEQVLALSGESQLRAGCGVLLERGVGCVAATCGGEGALVVDGAGATHVPAFGVEVVDTTGCGDAFSAGFLRGLSLGRTRRDAALLGCAAAALVAQGLGSDHGDFDLAATDALIDGSDKAVPE